MKVTAFVFARGGSKGLPGKNIKPLRGKPLIAWSIEVGLSLKHVSRVIVSTDCPEIAAVAREYGGQVPFMRPPELARDDSPEWLAWRHALNWLQDNEGALPEVMLSLPATAPLRSPHDIQRCLDEFAKGGVDTVITVTDSHRSPYFNMVKENPDGTVGLVIPPPLTVTRRQDAPPVFDMTTVAYVIRPAFVMSHNTVFEGRVRAVNVPVELSIDIDTLLDFKIAEMLMQDRMDPLTKG
jgi:CMP-N-acetylneuraminic acid synthetase